MSVVAEIATGKTDKQRADEVRAELRPVLEGVAAIIGAARAEGLIVSFSIGQDAFGRQVVTALDVVKPL